MSDAQTKPEGDDQGFLGLGGLVDATKKVAEDAAGSVSNAAGQAASVVSNTASSVTEGVTGAFQEKGEGAEGAEGAEPGRGSFFGGMWEKAQEAAQAAHKAALEAAEKAKAAAEEAAERAKEAAGGGGGDGAAEAGEEGEARAGFFTNMWDNAQKAAQDAHKSALEAAEHYRKAGEEAALRAKDGFAGSPEGPEGPEGGAVVKTPDGEEDPTKAGWFSSMWQAAQDAAHKAQTAAIEAAEAARKAAEETAKSAASTAQEAASSAQRGLTGAGDAAGEEDAKKDVEAKKAEAPPAVGQTKRRPFFGSLMGRRASAPDAPEGAADTERAAEGDKEKGAEGAAEGAEGGGDKPEGLVGSIWSTLLVASNTAVAAANVASDAAKNVAAGATSHARSVAEKTASLVALEGINRVQALYPGVHCIDHELVTTHITVASLNVWWRNGPWESRHKAVMAALRALDADVVCLQEVWQETAGEEGNVARDQAAELAAELGYKHLFEGKKALADREGTECLTGNAILSKFPIASHASKVLSTDEGRLVLRADLEGPRGVIQVFSLSCTSKMGASEGRTSQLKDLCNFVKASAPKGGDAVVAVCGSLNATPESDEIRALTGKAPVHVKEVVFMDAWETSGGGGMLEGGGGDTWSNANMWAAQDLLPSRRLDYILTPPPLKGGKGHVIKTTLFGKGDMAGAPPSAHYGLLAEIRY